MLTCAEDIRDVTQTMPDSAHLELGRLLTSAATARAWARVILSEWRLDALADDTGLILTELVTNAVLYASGCSLDVWLKARRAGPVCAQLAIMVEDSSPVLPNPNAAPDEFGRGLMIVAALTKEQWGAYWTRTGKIVWAALSAAAP